MASVVYGDFEWDSWKATINVRKHGVSFEEATTVFADPSYVLQLDRTEEDRLIAIGVSGLLRMLVVVHIEKGPRILVISARKAATLEEGMYEKRRG